MDLAEIERRLIRLEDIEAIKQLKARYCEICDDDHNPQRITSVFAEDGIWESAEFGTARGHAEIRRLFQGFQKLIQFSQHNVMNPIIAVDGDRATGEWYFLGPFTFREGPQARWLALQYKDDYVKLRGEWKYQHLRVNLRLAAPYDEGWAGQRIAPVR
ncbi:MAG: nuclear transport factor 2 family protein [Deltaproteobacteria bacterium]|nr:nuclear transport factor 2 family protein [Deltaproteobacteria bacterium]